MLLIEKVYIDFRTTSFLLCAHSHCDVLHIASVVLMTAANLLFYCSLNIYILALWLTYGQTRRIPSKVSRRHPEKAIPIVCSLIDASAAAKPIDVCVTLCAEWGAYWTRLPFTRQQTYSLFHSRDIHTSFIYRKTITTLISYAHAINIY